MDKKYAAVLNKEGVYLVLTRSALRHRDILLKPSWMLMMGIGWKRIV